VPRVTRLERTDRSGVLVHLDGAPFRHIPESVAVARALRVDDVLAPGEVDALAAEADRVEALDAALRFLSWRPRSRAELARHLRDRAHQGPAAEAALRRCEELGYVDDRAFALAFVRDRLRLRPRGRARLLAELFARGVDAADAESAIDRAFAESGSSEPELLRRLATRRARGLAGLDAETARRRLAGYLMRRGFPGPEVRAVVDEILDSD
jgi:regulatory protein